MLRRAVLDEILRNGLYDVGRLLRLSEGTPGSNGTSFTLTGGPKDFDRPTTAPAMDGRFVREDGAVIHFALTLLECSERPLELVAYGFEIYFPSGEPISFIRFDLNGRGHANEEHGLRAHLHPGHDDLQLPSPVFSPVDALSFLIYRCRLHREAPRARAR